MLCHFLLYPRNRTSSRQRSIRLDCSIAFQDFGSNQFRVSACVPPHIAVSVKIYRRANSEHRRQYDRTGIPSLQTAFLQWVSTVIRLEVTPAVTRFVHV
jgi:hypothetical protein